MPGDTDQSKKVEVIDLFNIGFAYGETGPGRETVSNQWTSHEIFPWQGENPDGTNFVHADCNGDGVVNDSDILAIILNWGEEHGFQDASNESRMDYPISIELQQITSDNELIFDIKAGNEVDSFKDFFGIHLQIDYPQNFVEASSATIIYPDSWLGQYQTNFIEVQKNQESTGEIDFAIAKKDHLGVDGYGKIAELRCRLKEEHQNSIVDFPFEIMTSSGIFSGGETFRTSSFETIIEINTVSLIEKELESSIKIISNPVKEEIRISMSEDIKIDEVRIFDIYGMQHLQAHSMPQNLSHLSSGNYYLQLFTNKGVVVKKFVLIE